MSTPPGHKHIYKHIDWKNKDELIIQQNNNLNKLKEENALLHKKVDEQEKDIENLSRYEIKRVKELQNRINQLVDNLTCVEANKDGYKKQVKEMGCQRTGLKDINGREICFGDKVIDGRIQKELEQQ